MSVEKNFLLEKRILGKSLLNFGHGEASSPPASDYHAGAAVIMSARQSLSPDTISLDGRSVGGSVTGEPRHVLIGQREPAGPPATSHRGRYQQRTLDCRD